uniref:hypothetical protein n=1 Tax=Trichocoleus desertorum TaxID=1481672 RepID=UPI0025B2DEC0|nr:hypothetical protein [Trichocoleus desertorum]
MSEIEPVDPSSSKPDDGAAIASKPYLVQLPCFVQPRRTQKTHRSSPTLLQLFALGLQVALFLAASASVVYGLFYSPLSLLSSAVYPAGIPWLTTPDSCEQTGRTWHQGRCFDYDHNPLF